MKKIHLIGSILAVMYGSAVFAQPSSKLAWTPATLAALKAGDGVKGKQIAETCTSCHANGGQFPYLDGQLAAFLFKQLHDYKDGSRDNPIMSGFVAGLSDKDMADVAVYYSQQNIPAGQKVDTATGELAERLVKEGDGRRILPPCASCHEASGKGQKIDVPAVASQNVAYLEQTLLDYKSGARHNDLYGRMRSIAQQLSTEEIKALARYYAGMAR